MPVTTTNNEYDITISKWTAVRDCLSGEDAIKAGRSAYLPYFVPHDEARYSQYLTRANFVNVTARTQKGLVGAIFRRAPQIELPAQIEHMLEDYDGSGQSLDQLGKIVSGELLGLGRIGLLSDYPSADPGLSAEDVSAMRLRATIATYRAEDIINWRAKSVGGSLVTTLVVLHETTEIAIDTFDYDVRDRYRVLALDDAGYYFQQVFDDDGVPTGEPIYPRTFEGGMWTEIPFVFAGADNNRPEIDQPPLYDLARVNIAHYRNSADHEESLFIHGQGTLFVSSDLSVEQWKEANPAGIVVGARKGHFLGSNGSATLLQVQANSAVREAMLDKEDTMRALGARLISQKGTNQTAEAARIDASSETSVLNNIANNASEAIESALEYACGFMGGDVDDVKYKLNTDFFDSSMTAQDVMAMIALEDRRTIGKTDVRAKLRSTGWVAENRTDDDLDADAVEAGI